MIGCGAMVLASLILAVRWGGRRFEPPPPIDAPSAAEVARRFAWYCSLLLAGGLTAGVLVLGAGGRLAMRLLAATGGDAAQGRVTEAEEVVGDITVAGTIGFVLFVGILGGVAAAALYLVARRLLPPGPAGGLCFGAALLVVFGTRVDPLRDENPDFDIVGPGWLSVLVFATVVIGFGAVLATFVARLSSWLPLPAWDRAVVVRYLPIAPVAAIGFSLTASLVVAGLLVVAASRWPPLVRAARSQTVLHLGRGGVAAVVLLSLPSAVQSIEGIVRR
jgi:hypothetical protein